MMKRGMVVAALCAGVFLALELLLRGVGYGAPVWYAPHPQLGWALRPGASGWYTKEGKGFVQVNTAGQRDREHGVAKPRDAYRIAVLGDGYSEAMEVALEQTYWAQLPARLKSCGFQPGKRIEVMNFGVRDYGTAQAYVVLESTALRYRPDLVLLQISHGNDLRDNSPALDPLQNRPYFRLEAGGQLALDDGFARAAPYQRYASPVREAVRRLVNRSRVLQLARDRVHRLKIAQSAHARDTGNLAGLEHGALGPPRDPHWQEAWRITEALIAGMRDLASRDGAALAVFTVPFAMQAHPDAAHRAALQSELGVADFSYPERRIASFAERNGIPTIVLGQDMQALATATGSYLYGFDNATPGSGHWNALGHRAAADIIARRLCSLG